MELRLFLPETLLLTISVLLLCLTLAPRETVKKVLYPFLVISSVTLVASCLAALRLSGDLFYSTYRVDGLSQGFKLLLSLAFLFTVFLSRSPVAIERSRQTEYYLFLSTSLLGMMMMTSAVDWLALYISMELSSYSLYLLAALRNDKKSAEGSVKYLILGAAGSGVFLWGVSLVVGLSGTTSLLGLSAHPALMTSPVFLLAMAFVSFAFLFKLSGFPMHFWAPDVYESAATPVVNFIATASKAAAVAILIRVFLLVPPTGDIAALLAALAFVSMTLGNCVALVQKDVKRLLAYSSIAQAGYLLIGLLTGSFEGLSSSFFYAIAYVLMNTAAFFVTVFVAKDESQDNPQLSHFDGLAERSPFLALILLLSLLSLAGIPPLVGFTGKWILFSAAMDQGHWFLVLWAVLNSVVSLFYYLTLVKHAYLEKPRSDRPITVPLPMKAFGLLLILAMVFLGIFPNPVIQFTQGAIAQVSAREALVQALPR